MRQARMVDLSHATCRQPGVWRRRVGKSAKGGKDPRAASRQSNAVHVAVASAGSRTTISPWAAPLPDGLRALALTPLSAKPSVLMISQPRCVA